MDKEISLKAANINLVISVIFTAAVTASLVWFGTAMYYEKLYRGKIRELTADISREMQRETIAKECSYMCSPMYEMSISCKKK